MSKKRSQITHLVVGEEVFDENSTMLMAIGAYSDPEKAYGAAYIYLITDIHEMDDGGDRYSAPYTISEPWTMEGDTGYGITLKGSKGKTVRHVYILSNDMQEGGDSEDE